MSKCLLRYELSLYLSFHYLSFLIIIESSWFVFVVEWVGQKGGCMIVDSTRKGKRFPDSMSKTIPIWTCVLNRAIRKHLSKTDDVSLLNERVSLVLIVYEQNRHEKFLNHNFCSIFY